MRTPLLPLPRPRATGALAVSVALALLFLLAALGFTPANASRREERHSRSTKSADFAWSERMREGQTLQVRGVNGAIEARAASGTEARVTAVKKGRFCDPDEVRIEVSRTERGIIVCAIYPGRDGDRSCRDEDEARGKHDDDDDDGDRSHRNCDVSVAFTVEVPAGVVFKPRTVNGGIRVEELDGEVHAETVNGSVTIETHDVATAQTVNGSIEVEMGRSRWDGDLEFKTVNGSITLDAPPRLSGKITAITVNGRIESDFPFTATSTSTRRRISGTIGDGGRGTMRLETLNGSIHLVQR